MLTVQVRIMHIQPLRTYLDLLPRGGVGAFAERLGVQPVYLSQLAAQQNGRVPSPELCVRIERLTERAVSRQDLRPLDWHLIWPELITAEGAPPVPETQEARDAA